MNYETLARPDWSNELEYQDELTALQNKYGISEVLYTRDDCTRLAKELVALILKDIQKEIKVHKHYGLPGMEPRHLNMKPKNPHCWNYAKFPVDNILKNYIKNVEALR